MLSTADLDGMRSTLDASLPDTCAISRATAASDAAGGQTDTPATVATVACRVSPASEAVRNAEQEAGARLEASSPWIITFPNGTDVREYDRVTSGGIEYEVSSTLAPRTWEIGRRVLCRRIR